MTPATHPLLSQLHGLMPPVPTPFTLKGKLELAGLQALITHLMPYTTGFVILGSNGEAAHLTEEERRAVLSAAREVIPQDKLMIAGTGGESTAITQQRTRIAAEVGADAALVIAPFYFKGQMSQQRLLHHFQAVADEAPIPVMLYNIPAVTTFSLSPSLIGEAATHNNIIGLKDSSGHIGNLTMIMKAVKHIPSFAVMTGHAPTLFSALALGATGGILAVGNAEPKGYAQVMADFKAGEIAKARDLQMHYTPLALAVTVEHGVPGLKAVLRLQGLPAGWPRAPLRDVSDEVKDYLQHYLNTL